VRRLAKRRVIKNGVGSVDQIPVATPPAWVHRGDPRFIFEPVAATSLGGLAASSSVGAIAAAPEQGGSEGVGGHPDAAPRIPLPTAPPEHRGLQAVGTSAELSSNTASGQPSNNPR
jgi:hypothetical protein